MRRKRCPFCGGPGDGPGHLHTVDECRRWRLILMDKEQGRQATQQQKQTVDPSKG